MNETRDKEIARRFTREPVIDIAIAFGISRSRVYQIIWKTRRLRNERPRGKDGRAGQGRA
jgi:Mor family transcriptional regulator